MAKLIDNGNRDWKTNVNFSVYTKIFEEMDENLKYIKVTNADITHPSNGLKSLIYRTIQNVGRVIGGVKRVGEAVALLDFVESKSKILQVAVIEVLTQCFFDYKGTIHMPSEPYEYDMLTIRTCIDSHRIMLSVYNLDGFEDRVGH